MTSAPTKRQRRVVDALLERYPKSYAQEAGVRRLNGPAGLFQLLVVALLMSARIRASIATNAARAVFAAGGTTAQRMADASWDARASTLNRAGYARYDERTSTMLGDTAQLAIEQYRGDLRRLRESAGRDPTAERRLLKEFKGVGDVGVDIYFREVQGTWSELHPFADRRALAAADRLGLGSTADALARVASGGRFVRVVNALVRADLDKTVDELRADTR